jgi:hypothetical protein
VLALEVRYDSGNVTALSSFHLGLDEKLAQFIESSASRMDFTVNDWHISIYHVLEQIRIDIKGETKNDRQQ